MIAQPQLESTFSVMASTVCVRIIDPQPDADGAMQRVREMFEAIERTCTRFDSESDLMRANAAGRRWTQVGPECIDVLHSAYEAYRASDGLFDPRTYESLVALGYDRSWEKMSRANRSALDARSRARTWRPDIDAVRGRVRVGPRPVDLGGIGKGFAVSRAMQMLAHRGRSILVEAGGDLAVSGPGPEDRGWRVQIEDPFGAAEPVAVWELTDTSIATSSIRRRQWMVDEQIVHHLIDPRTGRSAQSGLTSVTVVHPDTAMAEVWAKVAFLVGAGEIRSFVDQRGLPAVWVDDSGRVGYSKAATPLLIWKVSRVGR